MLLLFFKMSGRLCFYFYLFEELYKTFLKCLKEFIDKLSVPGFFFEGRFLNNRFKFFMPTELLIFSSSVSFGKLHFSKNVCISSKLQIDLYNTVFRILFIVLSIVISPLLLLLLIYCSSISLNQFC